MKTFINPDKKTWGQLLRRPVIDQSLLVDKVKAILDDVRTHGDEAVKKYSLQFDNITIDQLEVPVVEIDRAVRSIDPSLKQAIEIAAANISRFHEKQLLAPEIIETMPGVKCWRKSVAIDKIGLYIPGGTAPLFSTVLMLAIPAKIAGCKEIIMVSPPSSRENGMSFSIHPAVLFAARLTGVTKIFRVGGAQAIAAMAYGTETIPGVYKIFGPGNQYVNCAKQLIQFDGVGIDMPAGPSEVCIIADETCDPPFVAADLLSQAEHGRDSQVLLVCNDKKIVDQIENEIGAQATKLIRKDIVDDVMSNSNAIVFTDINQAIDLVNQYAPEHLIVACKNPGIIADQITNAGSVFLGNYSPESAGDYASGTNHVLPTNGYAKVYSGVSVDSFVKKITYQQISEEGLQQIGNTVELMAAAEGLDAHKNAISIRLKKHKVN